MPNSHTRPRDFALGLIVVLLATAISGVWFVAALLGTPAWVLSRW